MPGNDRRICGGQPAGASELARPGVFPAAAPGALRREEFAGLEICKRIIFMRLPSGRTTWPGSAGKFHKTRITTPVEASFRLRVKEKNLGVRETFPSCRRPGF
jgi:hypothetical protein